MELIGGGEILSEKLQPNFFSTTALFMTKEIMFYFCKTMQVI